MSKIESLGGHQEEESQKKSSKFPIWARYVALATALGAGTYALTRRSPETTYESGEIEGSSTGREGVEVKNPVERFTPLEIVDDYVERVIVPGEPSIIHIAQMHFASTLQETERVVGINSLIESQKAIEKYLLALQKKYNLKTVFVEGIITGGGDAKEMITESRRDIERNKNNPSISLIEFFRGLTDLIERVKADAAKGKASPGSAGPMLYFLKLQLTKEIDEFRSNFEVVQRGDQVLPKYREAFDQAAAQGVSKDIIIARLEAQRDMLAAHPLISGDQIYAWGGPLKLFIEGKMNIQASETMGVNQAVKGARSLKDFASLNENREDVALKMALEALATDPSQPCVVVYGVAHNFGNNLLELREQHPELKIGIRRIDPVFSSQTYQKFKKLLPANSERK